MTTGTLSKVIEKHQSSVIESEKRDYIGASAIGSDCWRQIWYEYNGHEGSPVEPKLRRTWDIGKRLEGLVIEMLELAGIDLFIVGDGLLIPGFKDSELDYFKGNVDAIWSVDGKPYAILEIKTAKDSSFDTFVKKGVKRWMPRYYAQIQAYMGMSGVHSSYILVLNKDNSELSDELVTFDSLFYDGLKNKARLIHDAVSEPPRVNGSPIWYQCKQCKFSKECHG